MHKETRWLLEEKYHGVATPEFHADVVRLEAGLPLAYVIGWVDFLGCRIDLTAHPLIPRPETEFWVEQAIAEVRTNYHESVGRPNYGSLRNGTATGGPGAKVKILDLFSGSGCIGVALLKHLPNATVDFGEKDSTLCAQIAKNIIGNNIDNSRTRIFETDVFSGITDSYDLIVANPPYIDPTKKETVEQSVLLHEPYDALFADDAGLLFIQQLLTEAGEQLNPGGTLFIEFGENQKEDIALLAEQTSWNVEFLRDQFGVWRVAKLLPH